MVTDSGSSVSLEALIARLRQESRTLEAMRSALDEVAVASAMSRASQSLPPPQGVTLRDVGEIPSEITNRADRRYHADEFLSHEGVWFLRATYAGVLGRPLDAASEAALLDLLRAGRDKSRILWSVANSAEGKACGATIEGLQTRAVDDLLCRLPVVGALWRMVVAVCAPGMQRARANREALRVALAAQRPLDAMLSNQQVLSDALLAHTMALREMEKRVATIEVAVRALTGTKNERQ